MTKRGQRGAEELPPDNVARIALYDAMTDALESDHAFDGLSGAELFERVISRLRLLVPRELHNQGEAPYVAAKVAGCLAAGVLQVHPRRDGMLLPGPRVPRVPYPDGTIRDYTPGLEAARERLDADESKLRRGGFDVRSIVRSPADERKSERYRKLVESMREHGFLEHYPIIESATGVLDGRAREAAAAEADVPLKDKHRVQLRRRDTPLQQALLVLHLNADRLAEDDVAKVHDAIQSRTGRSWIAIETDLVLTQAWRRAEPKDYDAKLDVELVPYSDRNEAKVQVTLDGTRVLLRSVTREAGLPEWARDDLLPYVAFEKARTYLSGRQAIFVRVTDAIGGIERMQDDRSRKGLRIDPAWNEVREWLSGLARRAPTEEAPLTETPHDGVEPAADT